MAGLKPCLYSFKIDNCQMQRTLAVEQVVTHSRKQIVNWVQSSGVFKFEDLKNGLFFLRILTKLNISEMSRHKIYEKPKNDYEFTHNLNLVKKILNKSSLQLNMNVAEVVRSKNSFELANWFRNLYDLNKVDNDDEFAYSQKSYTPSKVGTASYKSPMHRNISRATSSDVRKNKQKIQSLLQITDEFSNSKGKDQFFYTSAHQNSESAFGKHTSSNTLYVADVKEYSSRKMQLRKESSSVAARKRDMLFLNKTSAHIKIYDEEAKAIECGKKQKKDEKIQNLQTEDLQTLLREQALKENIDSFTLVLQKMQSYINECKGKDVKIGDLQNNIRNIIYMKEGSKD